VIGYDFGAFKSECNPGIVWEGTKEEPGKNFMAYCDLPIQTT